MSEKYSVLLSQLVEEHQLVSVHRSADFNEAIISSMAVGRPGLQFAGFYEYFDNTRMLVYGKQESTYLKQLSDADRYKSVEALMQHKPCALIVCHGVNHLPEVVELAEKYDINLFTSEIDTSELMAQLISSLHLHLAPRKTVHAVLVEVYGEGLLIMGDSGIGKSETALELIKRGHRLIADDAVEIRRISQQDLVGQAPALIRHYMEFRGLGIVNVRYIFGVGAVKSSQKIHLVVNLENWEDYKPYDRLGVESEYAEIMGVNVPSVTIPVRPGRNLAVILELAAMNNRQKKLGYNAAEDLEQRHDYNIDNDLFED
ncbi:MAG: HPr(Ser) kinase/phosphatase [Clostridia bacterium]|nr:HPr(Ser) kinase/phosphatase [Clostridia bacterium]